MRSPLNMVNMIDFYIDRVSLGVVAALILAATGVPGHCQPKKGAAKPEHSIYSQIADEGLSGIVCSGNVAVVKMACDLSHSDPDGKDWSDDSDGGVGKIFKFIDRQTTKILDFASSADTSAEDRGRALYHFGLVMRALEEFYLKSNYVELKIESAGEKGIDPYNMEPINWTKVGKDSRSIAISGFKFGEFDKSSVKTAEGAKKVDGATYFSIAKELSVKEAQREWNTIERLIRVKYPGKAAEIIVALKNASCSSGFKPDVDE